MSIHMQSKNSAKLPNVETIFIYISTFYKVPVKTLFNYSIAEKRIF